MQIFVKLNDTQVFSVAQGETVADLKAKLGCGQDVALYNCGIPLEDGVLVASHVADLATVEVCPRILGGKVHGSLARAGKVKGQTPKVDKAEKRKKRTGRAKRRVQYNRRFVNTVATFGRKKGPNSQSTGN